MEERSGIDVAALIARAQADPTILRDHIAAPPPMSLAAAARLVASGADPGATTRDLLDSLQIADGAGRISAVQDEPPPTGDPRWDAWLGALAEHVAAREGGRCPAWSQEPERFLDRFWFVSPTPGFRAVALAQAPVSFKRRGVMVPARSLERV